MNRDYAILLRMLGIDVNISEALKVRIDKTTNVTSNLTVYKRYKSKVILFFRVLLLPLFIFGRKHQVKGFTVGPTSDSGQAWLYFVKHYFGREYTHIDNVKCSIFFIRFDIIFLYIKMCIYVLRISGEVNQYWVFHLFKNLIKYECYKNEIEELYVFYINHPSPFIFAKYVEFHKVRSVIHMGNNPIAKWNYPFPISSPIILSSAIQREEVKYLKLPNDWQYCRDEFILFSKDVLSKVPKREVGLFSSGEWARLGGLYRSSDIQSIANFSLANNKVYQAFESGLLTLISLNVEKKFTIKVYPHPFERELIKSGIKPPYYKWVDSGEIEIDASGASSREKIYESEIAISYHSSFIWERLSLDLDKSYHFQFNDGDLDLVDQKAIGCFKSNIFFSNEELCGIIKRIFK
ncbi:hypothetical protein [Marinomonas foliarum]|uniref:Uncharacterized protein n=1 Tax=Marinomonas foliarum TaxID=491950 RepID=A0ABX7ISZ8_9GAMM|nr:hypothetical protein [Marinomonas foliarum]QRV25196.1 hypothetical protein JSY38_06715 [Marinomonas foliarum]